MMRQLWKINSFFCGSRAFCLWPDCGLPVSNPALVFWNLPFLKVCRKYSAQAKSKEAKQVPAVQTGTCLVFSQQATFARLDSVEDLPAFDGLIDRCYVGKQSCPSAS
jgi:hypothetical protein